MGTCFMSPLRCVAVISVMSVLCARVSAEDAKDGKVVVVPGTYGIPLRLVVLNGTIQEEIRMTPVQIDAVNQEVKRHVSRMRSIGRREPTASEKKGVAPPPSERAQAVQPQQRQRFIGEETDEVMAGILSESQRVRVSELCAQFLGVNIFRDPTIRRELKIAEAKEKQIDELFQELSFLSYEVSPNRRRFKRLNPDVEGTVEAGADKERKAAESRAKVKKLKEIATMEILDLLDENQRAEFAVRVGEPATFDITLLKFELKVPLAPEPEPEKETGDKKESLIGKE